MATFPSRCGFHLHRRGGGHGRGVWTVFSTKEYPPTEAELKEIKRGNSTGTLGLGRHLHARLFHLPRRMWELGLANFFTWIGMFSMWVYFRPPSPKIIFTPAPGFAGNGRRPAVVWLVVVAAYNASALSFPFVLLWGTKIPPQADACYLSRGRPQRPGVGSADWQTYTSCLISMTAVRACAGPSISSHALRHAGSFAAQGQSRR